MNKDNNIDDDEKLWYKDAIIYELDIKGFYDSNADGIGDFEGLTKKIDYLKDLGVNVIWLLPFYPSPLKDDGYDISDYFGVHSQYGTIRDFKRFLNEAHKRKIKVITELVLNHTSDQHHWFKRARNSDSKSKWRDFYVWSDNPERYSDARIIFKDFELSNWAWDPIAKSYYWHRFYFHQPDLNFDSTTVHKSLFKVVDFWFGLGVDGLRLDAVPYLYEREGTNCENLQETHNFLKQLRKHIDSKFKNKLLLAEANQWPADASQYFGNDDECHMAFHFPLMPRMFMAIKTEDRFPIVEILKNTPEIPENCQWAVFLRNHDELTLEMVTDEERDYMYRVYAKDKRARINLGIRRRLAPLLDNDRRKIELMNILLFTFPGTPVIYRGDEIGMGDNYYLGDRNGVRTPMQWSADLNAGFSRANPQKLFLHVIIDPEYHYETLNVENQLRQQSSLLWWMKRLISIVRKHMKTFGRGKLQFLYPDNNKVLAFLRIYDDDVILVVVNLSRNTQFADLNLNEYEGFTMRELIGGTIFPSVKNGLLAVTLGPYGYYIFHLRKESSNIPLEGKFLDSLFYIKLKRNIQEILKDWPRENLENNILPTFFKYNSKRLVKREIDYVKIKESVSFGGSNSSDPVYILLILDVHYHEGMAEQKFLPFSFASGEKSSFIMNNLRESVLSRVNIGNVEGVIYDSVYDIDFHKTLLNFINKKMRKKIDIYDTRYVDENDRSEITSNLVKNSRVSELVKALSDYKIINDNENEVLVTYNNVMIKIFKKAKVEFTNRISISNKLTQAKFQNSLGIIGSIHYSRFDNEPVYLSTIYNHVATEGNAWDLFLTEIGLFLEHALSYREAIDEIDKISLWDFYNAEPQESITGLFDFHFIDMVSILAKRTADFHLNLRSEKENSEFTPEPFGYLYQQSLSKSMVNNLLRTIEILKSKRVYVGEDVTLKLVDMFLESSSTIIDRFNSIKQKSLKISRSRIHGNYGLFQVLYTGKDFVIADIDSLPSKPLEERRVKASPLHDVADILSSFYYVCITGIFNHPLMNNDKDFLQKCAKLWYCYYGSTFLKSYIESVSSTDILPGDKNDIKSFLEVLLLDKSLHDLKFELENRHEVIKIPLMAIGEVIGII